jgi:hypothetical protein
VNRAFLLWAFLAAALPLSALDYGLTLRQSLGLAGGEPDALELNYTPGLGPWLSDSSGETLDIYLSAMVDMRYRYDELTGEGDWQPVPELGHSSLRLRPGAGIGLELGRVRYSDPNGLIVAGLFDGLTGSLNLGNSRLSLGALYSGLLYRETAKIFMSEGDTAWDYPAGDLVYSFAGRRLIAALGWETPSLFGSSQGLALNFLTQFDLNGAEESLDSRYLSFKFTFSPLPLVYGRLGGALGFTERREAGERAGETSLALDAGLDWALPGRLEDALSFRLLWASGSWLGTFRSVTLLSPSNLLSAGMGGLGALRTAYTARVKENLSLTLDGRYLFREDTEIIDTLPLTGGRALGAELYGSLVWVPLSDISVVWGGGAFFPGLGDAVQKDAAPRWKTMLTLVFSL